jgi:putative peptidoglycan lipid II flippase
MTTITPELARAANARDFANMRSQFETGLRYLILVVLPASIAYVVLAQPIVGILAHGAFSPRDAHVTADTLQLLAIGLLPFSVYLYVLRGFYALQDTRTPFLVNCFENGLNIVLALVLFPSLGVQGLALAYAGAYLVAAVVALVLLRRRIGGGAGRTTVQMTVRAAIAGVVLALAAAPFAAWFGADDAGHAVTAAVLGSLAGGLAYVGVLRLMGVHEIGSILGLLRRRRQVAPSDV